MLDHGFFSNEIEIAKIKARLLVHLKDFAEHDIKHTLQRVYITHCTKSPVNFTGATNNTIPAATLAPSQNQQQYYNDLLLSALAGFIYQKSVSEQEILTQLVANSEHHLANR